MIKGIDSKFVNGALQSRGYNIHWKRNVPNANEEITFIMAFNAHEALNKLLCIKGGFDKISIAKIQDYDRAALCYRGDAITADDENGILYQMIQSWNNSREQN